MDFLQSADLLASLRLIRLKKNPVTNNHWWMLLSSDICCMMDSDCTWIFTVCRLLSVVVCCAIQVTKEQPLKAST